jgi:hypothetical protein
MIEILKNIIQIIIPGLIISIITAFLTVKLSIKQFTSQRWWEKKVESYSKIIENLSNLQFCFEEWLSYAYNEKELGKEAIEKLNKNHEQAREKIKLISAIGAFAISKEASGVLSELVSEIDKPEYEDTWVEQLESDLGNIKKRIVKIVELAKVDLSKS